MMKREIFKIEGDKITRLRRNCPKCGEGIFLAEHKDRVSCGKCGYTEYKVKKQRSETRPQEEVLKEPEIPNEEPANEATET
jgi:small subunit ribosomal protein S27Ae